MHCSAGRDPRSRCVQVSAYSLEPGFAGDGVIAVRRATVFSADCIKERQAGQPVGGAFKRAFDIVGALVILVLAAPIMITVAALIRMALGGPAIFAQRRVGFDGREFVCYKFRTMGTDAAEVLRRHLASDPAAAQEWQSTRKLRQDPRVGCLGNILRKSSLDELPQLFNVLRGDMSLVGPRPVVPEEIARYGRHANACLRARPGLTGIWQTSGRNRISYTGRVARDLYYARNWSIWLDLLVLMRTIPAVIRADQTA
jgi:exopolysaccharide production protein ExoY